MTVAQLSVEAVARRLCLAAGHRDPDQLVYLGEPEWINTPIGRTYRTLGNVHPLWTRFEQMARAVLADIVAGRLG